MKKDTANEVMDTLQWGLKCDITPHFGARLAQEGNRLHYLADRARIIGQFSKADLRHLNQAFPLLMKHMELMLTSGELNPRHQHRVTLYAKRLTCEVDTLGSCGYVYIAIYPTQR
ncbi:TPA: type IV toxin-antitoxin system YeeU family antitoxin [Citrobacter freundii]|nr:type IV toxin-antitoxin system YeeU family antitoxin [Citrobacter freundii]HBB4768560.1 type IV toxin-antitoxin system YeeU family antitoxin [Citrobacter freundii]